MLPAFGLGKGCGTAETGPPEAAEAPPEGRSLALAGTLR